MERSGMGCSSLICRALAGAAWSPSKVGINPSILDRIPPAHPRSRTIEKIIAVAICLPTKIDATRFSVNEYDYQASRVIQLSPSQPSPSQFSPSPFGKCLGLFCWRAVHFCTKRNRTSVFRRRIDRCRCLDRSLCSKTIENDRKSHSVS